MMARCHTCQDTGCTHPTQEEILEYQILGEITGRAQDCACKHTQDVNEEEGE